MRSPIALPIRRVVLGMLLSLAIGLSLAQGEGSAQVVTYLVSILTEDIAFKDPANQLSYWFEIPAGMRVVDPCHLDLNCAYSTTILPGEGSLTVLLDLRPLASRRIPSPPGSPFQWRIGIPAKYLRPGWHEIRIASRQRSIEGRCTDIDHAANWIRVSESSYLYLSRVEERFYPLYTYPFPYLDRFAADPVQSGWYLAKDHSVQEAGVMLQIASDWGKREPLRSLALRVTTDSPASHGGNQVLIGEISRWGSITQKQLSPGTGMLWSLPPTAEHPSARLLISGAGAEGLEKAQGVLASPKVVSQLETNPAIIDRKPREETPKPISRLGSFTLAELGYPNITIAGAFHQRASITIRRPLRCNLGKGSHFIIHFRHSATLNPLRSQLTVYINGVPVGSAKLEPENAQHGVIRAHLPVAELAKSTWLVEFACYHDLGTLDCAKRYDEVAWTVIEGRSRFVLRRGKLIGYPHLENFPYLVSSNGKVGQPVTFWLSSEASDRQLTAAAIIAARAGQYNPTPIDWQVVKGNAFEPEATSCCVIMIGYSRETERFAALRGKLPVCPAGDGAYDIDPNLNLLPDQLKGAAVLEAAPSAWNRDGVLYVVLVEDDAALARFCRMLTDPQRGKDLGGDVCLLSRQGRVTSLNTVSASDRQNQIDKETRRLSLPASLIIVLLILALIVIIWVVRASRRR